jgi:hypothetical protein
MAIADMPITGITDNPVNRVASPYEIIAAAKWSSLSTFANQWFYHPDMMAIRIILIAIAAQFDPHSEPIWMFLNGPSGSGKTALGINPMMNLPNITTVDSLTVHTFLSGYIGSENAGLLKQIGPSGTILFPDFTTFLSLRDDNRRELASQMRRIYDGKLDTKNGAKTSDSWSGKLTIIAAVTPIIERYWGLLREMGDRFLQVRWPRYHGPSVAAASRKHQGREKFIADNLLRLTTDFFTSPRINYNGIPDVTDAQGDQLAAMAEIVCYLRAQVNREATGNREIRDVPQIEQTGRVGKGLPALVRYSAVLMRRDYINADDMAIASRIAIDCLPHTRAMIIQSIPPDDSIGATDLMKLTNINPSTLKWNMDELSALGIIDISHSDIETSYKMSSHIREMWKMAFPGHLNPT